jgi:hypothetical protein
MEALTERVERLETDEPGMRPTRWLVTEPVVERQTAEVKLIWDLQVKGIPVFNGERKAEMIRSFITEVMNMGGNETLMNAIFMSKLGTVARSWKQSVEREYPNEVPATTKQWLQRLRKDFCPEEMSNIKWVELTEIRQDHSLQWLVETFTELRNQVEHKTEHEVVRQFGIAANGYGNFKNIGQLILEEMVRAGVSEKPMTFRAAVHLAEKFASQEIELRRYNNQTQRGNKETPREEAKIKTSRGDEQSSRVDEQGSRGDEQGSQRGNQGEWQGRSEFPKGQIITERTARIWSKTVQNRYLKGQCFACGNRHKRPEPCTGPVINLKEHIKDDGENAKQKGAPGTIKERLDGYSLNNPIVTASMDESAEGGRSSTPSNKVSFQDFSLNNVYFRNQNQPTGQEESQQKRKGGSTTWVERKADLLTKMAKGKTTIKRVQNVDPMVFQGKFQATEQTFLIDSGCTAMVIGSKIVKRMNMTSKPCRQDSINQTIRRRRYTSRNAITIPRVRAK